MNKNSGTFVVLNSVIIQVGVVTIDMSSIGIKLRTLCRQAAGIQVCTVGAPCTAKSTLFCPNWYSFLEHFLELPVLPFIICVFSSSRYENICQLPSNLFLLFHNIKFLMCSALCNCQQNSQSSFFYCLYLARILCLAYF